MSFAWFIARRYLTARRRQAFISLISMVSILGVGVGVMALVIALALMTGVQSELRDRMIGSTAHITVFKIGEFTSIADDLRRAQVPGVSGAAPAVLGGAMLKSERGDTAFVMIKGIDVALEPRVTDIADAMRTGSISDLHDTEDDNGVVLGEDLAKQLGLVITDEILMLTPSAVLTPAGAAPHFRRLRVVGTFKFGFYEVDSTYAFMSLKAAEYVLASNGPDRIQLRLTDLNRTAETRKAIETALGSGYLVQDWIELNRPLYAALWLEKMAISLTIGLIVMVAALNIVASLVLLVMEKSRDIAILRTMGASSKMIRRIFVLQGLTIGLIGTLGGTVLGLIVCGIAEHYKLIQLPPDVYQIAYLQFKVLPLDVAIVVLSAVFVCYLATIYPSRQAGRLDPAEALRSQ